MSPTIVRQDGYIFVIYANDHPPAHVHVKKAENDARIGLNPVEVLHNVSFNTRELSKNLDITRQHLPTLIASWNTLHPLTR